MCSQRPKQSLPAVPESLRPKETRPDWLGPQSRRNFLGNAGKALALAGAASVFGPGRDLLTGLAPDPKPFPGFSPKTKRVIHLFMAGGPSQLDTWDPKPNLQKYLGQNLPESVRHPKSSAETAPARPRFAIAPSPFRFAQHGQSGQWISELFPHTARVADELAIVKSVHTDANDHKSATAKLTAAISPGTAAITAPAAFDPADLSGEPESTWDLYGPEAKIPGTFAHQCLLARHAAERDVRFTRIFHGGWDMHLNLPNRIRTLAAEIDRPIFALIADLRHRGLLDDTLVIWGGEFGRTVYSESGIAPNHFGRDHHSRCFSIWMAGGGVRAGVSYGETDDFSYNIVKDPVHVRDLHATIGSLIGSEPHVAQAVSSRVIDALIA